MARVKRRRLTQSARNAIAASQCFKCANPTRTCPLRGENLTLIFDVDHVVPLCEGGSDTLDNMQALCPTCHAVKTRTRGAGGGAAPPPRHWFDSLERCLRQHMVGVKCFPW